MNREIKLRVFNKTAKCYVMHLGERESTIATFDLLTFSDYINRNNIRNIDCFIVQQFTGIKDKNGTEIYENDILQDVDYSDCPHIVAWGNTFAGWLLKSKINEDPDDIE